jgi:hypothetical protein
LAEEVVAFVASTGTLPVGTGIVFDSLTIGGSTGKAEMIKLLDGTAGSSVPIPASSNGLGAVGLNVFNVNTTANPMGVSLAGGQSSVSVTGNVNVTFSTASTGSVIIANTTANAGFVQLAMGSTAVSTAAPLAVQLVSAAAVVSSANPLFVNLQTSTATVTIQGNSTVTLTTASKGLVELSSANMGGSSANPVVVVTHPYGLAATYVQNSTVATTTAALTLFSSAASTRYNITTLVITNAGTAESVIRIYDGTTAGTKMFMTDLASAGGGVSVNFPVPIRGTSGNAVTLECIPASTIYINCVGFKSA